MPGTLAAPSTSPTLAFNGADWKQVHVPRESLRYLGNFGWKTSTDPDNVHEPLLDVSRVAALGTFSLGPATTTPSVPLAGGVVTVPVTVNRSPTFFERVILSIQGVPSGWSATLGAPSLFGWTANATTATITVPKTAVPGTYQLTVVGTNWGRTSTSTITVPIEGMPFTDLEAFSTQIEWLYNAGITTGCSPTLFCPTARVTRAQMALFLDRALDLPAATTDYFDDDDGKTGEVSINALAKAGITGGCGPRRFCPSSYVTRAQMAMFLDRALALPAATTDYFDDDDGKTGEGSINALAKAAITGGCGPRRYCPASSVTREQMAAFLYRAHIQGRID